MNNHWARKRIIDLVKPVGVFILAASACGWVVANPDADATWMSGVGNPLVDHASRRSRSVRSPL